MQALSSRALGAELIKRGLIPPECRSVELHVTADGVLILRFETHVTADRLAAFADAMRTVAERSTSSILAPNN